MLLVNVPRMLSDVMQELLSEAGGRIVGELNDASGLLLAAAGLGADVVVVGTNSEQLPPELGRTLAACSRFKLLSVEGEGRRGFLYELEPRKQFLGEITGDVLRRTLAPRGAEQP